ncbi:ROK family protein [Evansella sp. AB-rgal1]|uniref:ROK family protein n=1 Tax=Evansella sp. AB-rgal1 TaxID=3242696 RepID=UPI00359CE838
MYRIGIDIGGTNMRVGVFADGGVLICKKKVPTHSHEGVAATIERLKELINQVLQEGNLQILDMKGIGIGSPGPLDPFKGEIQAPPNLPSWKNVPLKQIIQAEYNIPVFLHNDANAAALGEYLYSYKEEVKNLVYITVSTGIGSGVIVDGTLMLGHNGNAGEVGHMIIRPDGEMCGCGNRGCLEAQASGTGIASLAKKHLRNSNASSTLRNVSPLTSKEVLEAAQQGDNFATTLMDQVQTDLAIGITNVVHAYNPQKIVFGGGVMESGDTFINAVIEKSRNIILPSIGEGLEFSLTTLGGDLGLYGAAALVDYFEK